MVNGANSRANVHQTWMKALLKFTLPPWENPLQEVPHITFISTNQLPVVDATVSFLPCRCILYRLMHKPSLMSMTKATTSYGRKYCIVLTYVQLYQTSLQLWAEQMQKIITVLPVKMLLNCWWVLVDSQDMIWSAHNKRGWWFKDLSFFYGWNTIPEQSGLNENLHWWAR